MVSSRHSLVAHRPYNLGTGFGGPSFFQPYASAFKHSFDEGFPGLRVASVRVKPEPQTLWCSLGHDALSAYAKMALFVHPDPRGRYWFVFVGKFTGESIGTGWSNKAF